MAAVRPGKSGRRHSTNTSFTTPTSGVSTIAPTTPATAAPASAATIAAQPGMSTASPMIAGKITLLSTSWYTRYTTVAIASCVVPATSANSNSGAPPMNPPTCGTKSHRNAHSASTGARPSWSTIASTNTTTPFIVDTSTAPAA